MDKKPQKENGLRQQAKGKKPQGHSNAASAQRQRLLAWLITNGTIDTITARSALDILGVAPRILELRKHHRIDTVWTQQPTDCGKLHRVALYVLLPEG